MSSFVSIIITSVILGASVCSIRMGCGCSNGSWSGYSTEVQDALDELTTTRPWVSKQKNHSLTQSQFDKLWTMTDPLLPNATKNGFRKPKSADVSMAYAHASSFTKSSGQSWRPRQLQYKLTVELKVLTTMLQSTSSYFPCLTLNT